MKIQKRQTSFLPKNSSKKPASLRVKSKQHSSTIYNSLHLKETAFKGFCESPKWVKPDSLSRVQLLLQKLTLYIVPFSVYPNNKIFSIFSYFSEGWISFCFLSWIDPMQTKWSHHFGEVTFIYLLYIYVILREISQSFAPLEIKFLS